MLTRWEERSGKTWITVPRRAKFEAHIHDGEKLRVWDHFPGEVVFTGEEDAVGTGWVAAKGHTGNLATQERIEEAVRRVTSTNVDEEESHDSSQ